MRAMFKLTITVNLSDGSEINDIEVPGSFTSDDIGNAAVITANAVLTDVPAGVTITSLVIIAVVA